MKENIEIHTEPGTTTLIVREGKALDLFNPSVVEIHGTIDAPLRFIKARLEEIQPHKNCNILVNTETGKIGLSVDETNPFGAIIEGQLILNADIQNFRINDGKYQLPEDLATFLRVRKHLFKSPDTYMTVFTGLRSFTAKVNQVISAIRTDTGDYESKKSQAVEHNIPKGFTLLLPIFKGMPKVEVGIEILVDKNLNVTMYSSDLIQMEAELRELYLNDEVKAIQEIAPEIVIINV
jgi:hypothetical protein